MIVGLDLLGTRPWLVSGVEKPEVVPAEPRLPSVLLPIHRQEKPPAGPDAAGHRRGAGLPWPPEAQVPVLGDPACGAGRVPVVGCYRRLLDAQGQDDGWSRLGDTNITWRPDGSKDNEIGETAQALIANATSAWTVGLHPEACGLVVPDDLLDSAQQALIDAHRGDTQVSLLPTTMAHALAWCRWHAPRDLLIRATEGDGTHIGHVLVADLSWLSWRLTRVPIHAVRDRGNIWLVPIQDRHGIRYQGLTITLPTISGWELLRADRYASQKDAWLTSLLMGDWPEVWDEQGVRQPDSALEIPTCGWPLDGMVGRTSTVGAWLQGLSRLAGSPTDSGPCHAVVVAGAAARLHLSEQVKLWQQIGQSVGHPPILLQAVESAKAGWTAACGALVGEPTWREVIAPMHFFCRRRNEYGDLSPDWINLIETHTIDAGKEYVSRQPIVGLAIPAGHSTISMVLKRTTGTGKIKQDKCKQIHGSIGKSYDIDIPVELIVKARAGQGRAKVLIDDVDRPSRYSGCLDWDTMEDESVDDRTNRELMRYGYIRDCIIILGEDRLWEGAVETLLVQLASAIENKYASHIDPLTVALREKLNKWQNLLIWKEFAGIPVSPAERAKSHFLFVSVFGSDGMIPEEKHGGPEDDYGMRMADGGIKPFKRSGTARIDSVERLLTNIEKLVTNRAPGQSIDDMRRLCAWMYQRNPAIFLNIARRNFINGKVEMVDLHTAGLCFSNIGDMRIFWSALIKTPDRNNEWWRSARNITRFNQHALCPEAIMHFRLLLNAFIEDLQTVAVSASPTRSRSSVGIKVAANLIEILPFLLKRRRYEPWTLTKNGEGDTGRKMRKKFDDVLAIFPWGILPNRLAKWPELITRFLDEQATEDDVMIAFGQ